MFESHAQRNLRDRFTKYCVPITMGIVTLEIGASNNNRTD